MEFVSVIIPTYNRINTLGRCINSVLNQTYKNCEIIVVDDNSTDNTTAYIKQHYPQINYIRLNKNYGAQHARNIGIKNAKSDWIAFLDSDDEWYPNKLLKQFNILKIQKYNPYTVIHCNCIARSEDSKKEWLFEIPKIQGIKPLRDVLKLPGPMFQALLTSKIVLEKIGYLDENVPSYQEWDTSIRLGEICQWYYINEPLFIYHVESIDNMSNNKLKEIDGYYFIIKKYQETMIKNLGTQGFANHLVVCLNKIINIKRWDKARSILKELNRFPYNNKLILSLSVLLKINPKYLFINNYINFLKDKLQWKLKK